MDLSRLWVKRRDFSKGEQFPSFSAVYIHSVGHYLWFAQHYYSTEVESEEEVRQRLSYGGCKDGRLYNGGLIFHAVVSHHQEKKISEIKNEISSAHGHKPHRL